ncbi:MAG: peroxiredoxin family protein [Flavobacteriaceae bacterium]
MENKLKSIFVMLFINSAAILMLLYAYLLITNGFNFIFLGNVMVSFTISFLFAKAMLLHNTARTSPNMWLRSSIILIGLFLVLYGFYNSPLNKIHLIPAIALTIGWFLYVFWYSRFGKRSSDILEIGLQLPNFELEDGAKNKIKSSSFKGNPVIFMFYRGNWCPICMAQIKELVQQYKTLEERGAQVVLVSPQPHHFTKGLAKKFDVKFNFLVDVKNKVAKQLGIFHKNGLPAGMQVLGYDSDTVMPTLVICDKNSKILFVDLTDNYRVRPEPEVFLQILDGTFKKV